MCVTHLNPRSHRSRPRRSVDERHGYRGPSFGTFDKLVDLVQAPGFGTLVEAGLVRKKNVGRIGAGKENNSARENKGAI